MMALSGLCSLEGAVVDVAASYRHVRCTQDWAVPRRLHRVPSPLSSASSPASSAAPEAAPAGPIARKSGTGMPVVGMVGGGQLARMTAAAAVGLGATFRVLAESPSESAALVTHDVTVGSHLSLPDVSAFAGRCDVITFDHEHVPGRVLAELESAGVLVRPGFGRAAVHPGQAGDARAADVALGVPCPRYAPVSSVADVDGVRRGLVAGGAQGGQRRLRRQGRLGLRVRRGEAEDVVAHGIALLAEEFVPFRRELAALVARSPSGQGAAYPVVQTVQVDGICREVIAPAPGLDPDVAVEARGDGAADRGRARRDRAAGRRAVRDGGTAACSSTSWRCGRTTAGTGRSTARGRRSSSSTCGRCSTCRSGPARLLEVRSP